MSTIGKREILNSTIHLEAYNPSWPVSFASLEKEIRMALKAKVHLLEHVGSTSVPGLAAKPIIDMVLAVLDSSNEAGLTHQNSSRLKRWKKSNCMSKYG